MGEFITFFLILCLFYLEECLEKTHIQKLHVLGGLFCSIIRGGGKYKKGLYSWIFKPPAFVGNSIECQMDTVSFSENGLCNVNLNFFPLEIELPGIVFKSWDGIEEIASKGNRLLINGKPFADCVSGTQAAHYAKLLKVLKNSCISRRKEIISNYISRSVDVKKIRNIIKNSKQTNSDIRLLSFLHFLFIFCFLPVYNCVHAGIFTFVASIFSAFLLSLFVVAYSLVFFKNMRLSYAFKWIFMFPFISIYLKDLSKPIPSFLNPYAVLLALKSSEKQCAIVNKYIRSLKYPVFRRKTPEQAEECINSFNGEIIGQMRQTLIREKCDPVFLETEKIMRLDPSTRSYCPKCLNEFIIDVKECPDCGCKHILQAVDNKPNS